MKKLLALILTLSLMVIQFSANAAVVILQPTICGMTPSDTVAAW